MNIVGEEMVLRAIEEKVDGILRQRIYKQGRYTKVVSLSILREDF